MLMIIFIHHRMVGLATCKQHADNTEQDLTKEEYKTSHLLSICYSITALDNLDINLTIGVGMISPVSLKPKNIRVTSAEGGYVFGSVCLSVCLSVE